MRSIWFNKRFTTYAIGLMIDRLGNAVYSVVLPLLVYDLTKSVLDMSLMAICQFIPRVICIPFIGPIVDKVSKRKVIFSGLIFQSVCSLILAIMYASGALQMWMVYVNGALISTGFEFSRMAEISLVPAMFPKKRVEAISTLASAHTLMFMIGPILAGVLLGPLGFESLLWLNAISYFGPITMCIWSKIPNDKHADGIRSVRSVIKSMQEGLYFIKDNLVLKRLMLITVLVGIPLYGIQTMIIYYLKNDFVASDTFSSIVIACSGAGFLFSSLFFARFKNWRRDRFFIISLSAILAGLSLFLVPNEIVILIAQFILSFGTFSLTLTNDILIQEIVPNEILGRVSSFMRMVWYLTLSLSPVFLGFLINFLGTKSIFIIPSFLVLLTMILIVKGPLKLINKEVTTRG